MSERSWHKAAWEHVLETKSRGDPLRDNDDAKQDLARFVTLVGSKELRRLEAAGVQYYLPRPGARCVLVTDNSRSNSVNTILQFLDSIDHVTGRLSGLLKVPATASPKSLLLGTCLTRSGSENMGELNKSVGVITVILTS